MSCLVLTISIWYARKSKIFRAWRIYEKRNICEGEKQKVIRLINILLHVKICTFCESKISKNTKYYYIV